MIHANSCRIEQRVRNCAGGCGHNFFAGAGGPLVHPLNYNRSDFLRFVKSKDRIAVPVEARDVGLIMKIAALVDDLFFSSKISEVARQTGSTLAFCRSAASVPPDADRICVDLNASTFDPVDAIRRLAASHKAPITAYLSHVQTELAQQAAAAGAGEVLPRSVFVQRLPTLFRPES